MGFSFGVPSFFPRGRYNYAMLKKRIAALSILGLLLLGCSSKGGYAFVFSDDPELPYVDRQGENLNKSGLEYGIEELTRPFSFSEASRCIKENRPFLMYLFQDGCPTCSAVHDDIVSFLLDSGIDIFGAYFRTGKQSETLNEIRSLTSAYPDLNKVIPAQLSTPRCYLIKNESQGYEIAFRDHMGSLFDLESFFASLLNITFIHHFSTYPSYSSFLAKQDCLTVVDDGSPAFYLEEVRPVAIHSPKPIAHIEYASMSEEDQNQLGESLSPTSVSYKDKTVDYSKEKDEAKGLVQSYFG